MRDSIAEFFAIARSSRFTAYAQGVSARLPTGENVAVKIERTSKSLRPPGMRFSTFAFMTEVSAGDFRGVGFGEAPTQLVALQKSIAEGIERALYKSLKSTPFGTLNSNGWAAHISKERALESAVEELVERDAILVHWLGKLPMTEIAPATWPTWLTRWTQEELRLATTFNRLRVLVSSKGYKPTITTVLLNDTGHAVLSHATAASIEQALPKALAETCRIAQIAMEGINVESSATLAADADSSASPGPEDHAMYYAYHEPLPLWIFGKRVDWSISRAQWRTANKDFRVSILKSLAPKFHQIADGPIVVGYATSDLIQSLYFGRSRDAQAKGLINVRRMKELKHEGELNLMPHCVP
jgi:hypothetical protein